MTASENTFTKSNDPARSYELNLDMPEYEQLVLLKELIETYYSIKETKPVSN